MTADQYDRELDRLEARLNKVDDLAYYARYVAHPAYLYAQEHAPEDRATAHMEAIEAYRNLWIAIEQARAKIEQLTGYLGEAGDLADLARIQADYLGYSPRPEAPPTDRQTTVYLLWSTCTQAELRDLSAAYHAQALQALERIADPAPLCIYPDRLELLAETAAEYLDSALTLQNMAATMADRLDNLTAIETAIKGELS